MRRQRTRQSRQRSRRRFGTLGVAAVLPMAGCLGGDETEAATTTPEANHPIRLVNERDQPVEIRVTVVRESTGETVYSETHQLVAGEGDKTVYNTRDANPSGIESFRIELTSDGETVSERIETSACYGEVIGVVSDDGTSITYAVC